jgi:hypothetical protein
MPLACRTLRKRKLQLLPFLISSKNEEAKAGAFAYVAGVGEARTPKELLVRLRLEVRALAFIILAGWLGDQPFGASDPTDHENPYEQYRHPLHPTVHSALARRA